VTVTELDTSEVEGTKIPVTGSLENADELADSLDDSVSTSAEVDTSKAQSDLDALNDNVVDPVLEAEADTTAAEEKINGVKVDLEQGLKATIKMSDGGDSEVEGTIEGWNLEDQTVTFTGADGEAVVADIKDIMMDPNTNTLKITTVDGSEIITTLEGFDLNNQYITLKLANQKQITLEISNLNFTNDKLQIQIAGTESYASIALTVEQWEFINDKLTLGLAVDNQSII
jgi:hypothetical protein